MTAATVKPDAKLGLKAVQTLAKFLLVGLGGGALAAVGVAFGFGGLIAAATGHGTTLLCVAGGLVATGGGLTAATAFAAKRFALRNLPHLQEIETEKQREELAQARAEIAAKEAAVTRKEMKRAALAKEFNDEAVVTLKKGVKTMRPLKLNIKPPQNFDQAVP